MVESKVNPWSKLVSMLRQRLIRQESALLDSRLQLESAVASERAWDDDQVKVKK